MNNKIKILMIDDEEDFCFFVSKNLENTGEFAVTYTTDPDKGLRIARSKVPDLILLDNRMPKKEGLKVLEILKSDIKTISIPVIMLTALEDEQLKQKASWLYIERYITKPAGLETLRTEIDKVLGSLHRNRVRNIY